MNILNGFLFLQEKHHHRCSSGLYIGLRKQRNFQSELRWRKSWRILQRVTFLFEFNQDSRLLFVFKTIITSCFILIRTKFF